MNVFVWIVQVALAALSFAGGAYKVFSFDQIAKMPQMAALPRAGWAGVGAFEVVCAVLLIVPAATSWRPGLTPVAAVALAVESLALAAYYARYSLELTATNPMVWAVAMALMATSVAYARSATRV